MKKMQANAHEALVGSTLPAPIAVARDPSLKVLDLGVVDTRLYFSRTNALFPIGYHATRVFHGTTFTCRISDGNNERPIFTVHIGSKLIATTEDVASVFKRLLNIWMKECETYDDRAHHAAVLARRMSIAAKAEKRKRRSW